MRPLVGDQHRRRVRGIAQGVVIDGPGALADLVGLPPDRDHRIAEPVDLGQVLALGRLDHQRPGNRERHRRRVETVVDESLGHVFHGHPGPLRQRAQVQDALVRHQTITPGVEDGEVGHQPVGDVVGVENRHRRGLAQAVRAHQADVRPGNHQDARRPPRRPADRSDARARPRLRQQRMIGQVGREPLDHRDRTDPRATTAVRDAERLVQVQVAHVRTEHPRLGQPHQGVQVRAVDIDQAAAGVHQIARPRDALLVDTVRGRVGHHERGEPVGVCSGLGGQIGQIDVAIGVAGHHDDPHPSHGGAGRVRPVRRRRDQADVTGGRIRRIVVTMVGADRQQSGELALAASVRLERHGRVPGDGGEPLGEITNQLQIAGGLVQWGERVDVGEVRPGHRRHLGRRVELHRAGSKRDHATVERQVLVRETA